METFINNDYLYNDMTRKTIKVDYIIHKSGLTEGRMLLLKPFVKKPWERFTANEIQQISGNKSHHYVFEALKKFKSVGLLNEEVKGGINLYSLNYNNSANCSDMAFVEQLLLKKRQDIPQKNILKLVEKQTNPFFSLFVGGSYAEKKQKPTSDLDIAIIIPNCEQKKQYEISLKDGELMIPEIHGFVFTQEELYLMLINKEFNYGKELAKKHIIIWGAEAYYKVLFEALKNGFKG